MLMSCYIWGVEVIDDSILYAFSYSVFILTVKLERRQ